MIEEGMSAPNVVFGTLACNGCGETVTALAGPNVTPDEFAEAIIDMAAYQGWVRAGVLDYCPSCAQKAATN